MVICRCTNIVTIWSAGIVLTETKAYILLLSTYDYFLFLLCVMVLSFRPDDAYSSALVHTIPDSKVHGANMGPIWGRQDPGGPHVGPMTFAIWDGLTLVRCQNIFRTNADIDVNGNNLSEIGIKRTNKIWFQINALGIFAYKMATILFVGTRYVTVVTSVCEGAGFARGTRWLYR